MAPSEEEQQQAVPSVTKLERLQCKSARVVMALVSAFVECPSVEAAGKDAPHLKSCQVCQSINQHILCLFTAR